MASVISHVNGTKTKILFLCESVTLAHVVRPLVLASGLDPARYEIHIACSKEFHGLFFNTDFVLHHLECVGPKVFQNALYKGKLPYDKKVIRSYIVHDRRIIQFVQPDLIVNDFRLSGGMSARLEGVPSAMISNAYWSPFAERAFPVPDFSIARLLTPTLLKPIFPLIGPKILSGFIKPINNLRDDLGLEKLNNIYEWYTEGDQCFYADIPYVIPTKDLPSHHRYIGPVMWSTPTELPDWWDKIPNDKPLIYLNMGSSGGLGPLPKIIEALGELDVNVMFATAERVDSITCPKNFWVAEYLPGELAAKRSQIMIGNGGGAHFQALKYGVPVIGLPSNMDQFLNMLYILKQGAGIQVRNDGVSKAKIQAAVTEILEHSKYTTVARQISKECQKFDCVRLFEKYISKNLSSSSKAHLYRNV